MSIGPETSIISIIIPALNEEEHLAATLSILRDQPGLEIIVVDGGSRDKTRQTARSAGAMVIDSAPGRGRQQNLGAAAARGDLLLFLHADTLLPPGAVKMIRESLSRPGTIAGAFRLKIAEPGLPLRLVEWGANLRSRLFGLPYGDQALFIAKDTFQLIGGFPELPAMEDFAFVGKVKKRGEIKILPAAVSTSGRRWRRNGVLKVTLVNQLMIIGYFLGFSPASLASLYRSLSSS